MFFFLVPILTAILYVNTVSLLKKSMQNKDTSNQTAIGVILTLIISFGVMFLITTSS